MESTELIDDPQAISELAARLAAAGRFAMDLEFVSMDRYVPDLALLQLAWEEEGEQHMVLVEAIETELDPLVEQIQSPDTLVVAHGAKQDLSLLGTRFGCRAQRFVDTQIAAAFAGIAEQIGYARLVEQLMDTKLDKGPQFTDWLHRPLSKKQLRYALDDVRYLLPMWDRLKRRLDQAERTSWAFEESMTMASGAAERRPIDEAYKGLGGWNSLKASSLGALRALAAWREELALADNIPPSWILSDGAAVELCRRRAKSERDMKKVRGMGSGTVRKYGEAILDAIAKGQDSPLAPGKVKASLDPSGQAQAAVVTAMVAGRAAEIGIPPKSIAAKADAEALIRHARGQAGDPCKLLEGWRAEVIGSLALDWIEGRRSLLADDKVGVRLSETA